MKFVTQKHAYKTEYTLMRSDDRKNFGSLIPVRASFLNKYSCGPVIDHQKCNHFLTKRQLTGQT